MAGTSFNLSSKISGHEAVAWTQAVLNAKDIHLTIEEVTLLVDKFRPTDFKNPRKPRTSKISSNSSQRSEQEYDPSLCNARIWLKGGFSGQCSCKYADGATLCKRHQNEADKHSGMIKNGFFNAERPTHHYGDESLKAIPWADLVVEEETNESTDCLLYTSPSPRD